MTCATQASYFMPTPNLADHAHIHVRPSSLNTLNTLHIHCPNSTHWAGSDQILHHFVICSTSIVELWNRVLKLLSSIKLPSAPKSILYTMQVCLWLVLDSYLVTVTDLTLLRLIYFTLTALKLLPVLPDLLHRSHPSKWFHGLPSCPTVHAAGNVLTYKLLWNGFVSHTLHTSWHMQGTALVGATYHSIYICSIFSILWVPHILASVHCA